jgi:hypothetical protein
MANIITISIENSLSLKDLTLSMWASGFPNRSKYKLNQEVMKRDIDSEKEARLNLDQDYWRSLRLWEGVNSQKIISMRNKMMKKSIPE